jgi:DNA invertase Pin-like site-specific DNA recombinase
MQWGYARVSTVEQDTALQVEALNRVGVDRLVQEKRSGVAARPMLGALLYSLRRGDVLVVYKVDRLARSLVDLMVSVRRTHIESPLR